jgi:phosphoglycerate dehydrogenase-like enzyme
VKIVCYDPHARRNDLEAATRGFTGVTFERPASLGELSTSLSAAEILVIGNRAYSKETAEIILEHGQALRWIQFTTSGLDNATKFGMPPGLVITNASGLRAFCVAEHALMLMLALVRSLRKTEQGQRSGAWCRDDVTPSMDNLAGKHLVIVGAGAIGQEIARKAAAFDMHVTGVSRSTQFIEHFSRMRPRAELKDAASRADILLIAANYDDDTFAMISRDIIAAMPAGSYLVNIARGAMIDEEALVDALQQNRLAGAGLDVTEIEPLPTNHPLYGLPNVIVTPHIGGAGSSGTGAGMGKILADNLRLWVAGEKLEKVVIDRTP